MNCSNTPKHDDLSEESLWLVVQRGEASDCFEFPPHCHKAIVVGSSDAADLRIDSVAPVACFLERDGESLAITPACPEAQVRLDMQLLEKKRCIFISGVLELGDSQLQLRLSDTPPTLRATELPRRASKISDVRCRRVIPGVGQLSKTTEIDYAAIQAALSRESTPVPPSRGSRPSVTFACETTEMSRGDLEHWFETAFEQAISSDANSDGGTETIAGASSDIGGPASCKRRSRSTVNPYRTIELSGPLLPPTVPLASRALYDGELCDSAALRQNSASNTTGDTTEFEIPAAAMPIAAAGAAAARHIGHTIGDDDSTSPSPMGAIGLTQRSAVETDTPSRRRSTSGAKSSPSHNRMRLGRKLLLFLEKIGIFAQQRPVFMLVAAIAGAVVLMTLLLGAAKLVGLRPRPGVSQSAGLPHMSTIPSTNASDAVRVPGQVVRAAEQEASAMPSTSSIGDGLPAEDVPALLEAPPEVTTAAGHLFAGRLPEAEQAYRELSARYPNDVRFHVATRLLSRRNSPVCRAGKPSATQCPMVRQ